MQLSPRKLFNKGFTIIEVIAALTVFTIGILGIEAYFSTSSNLAITASKMSTASNLAQGIIDEQVAKSYDELTVGTSIKTRVSADSTNPFYGYQKQITISKIDNNMQEVKGAADSGMKKIDVTVFYQQGSVEKNVELATIKVKGAEPAP